MKKKNPHAVHLGKKGGKKISKMIGREGMKKLSKLGVDARKINKQRGT